MGETHTHQRRQHSCHLQVKLHQTTLLSHRKRNMRLRLANNRRLHLCTRPHTSSDSHRLERCCSLCCQRMLHHFGRDWKHTRLHRCHSCHCGRLHTQRGTHTGTYRRQQSCLSWNRCTAHCCDRGRWNIRHSSDSCRVLHQCPGLWTVRSCSLLANRSCTRLEFGMHTCH